LASSFFVLFDFKESDAAKKNSVGNTTITIGIAQMIASTVKATSNNLIDLFIFSNYKTSPKFFKSTIGSICNSLS
jgi:hypothetical protein